MSRGCGLAFRAEPEKRAALEREAAAAQNKLELDRARLEFFDQLGGLESSRSGDDDDLEHQIEALQEAVPELRSSTASQPVASAATGSASGHMGRAPAPARAAAQPEPPARAFEATTDELVRHLDEDTKAARARPAADPARGCACWRKTRPMPEHR